MPDDLQHKPTLILSELEKYFLNSSTFLVFGTSQGLLSFLKWLLALVITIVLVPKLGPWIQDYIKSKFITDIGLGIFIYLISLFIIINIGKAISSAVTYSGLGSVDKIFGLVFVYPEETNFKNGINVKFSHKFTEVKIDLETFKKKITNYLDMLYKNKPPPPPIDCGCHMHKFFYDPKKLIK